MFSFLLLLWMAMSVKQRKQLPTAYPWEAKTYSSFDRFSSCFQFPVCILIALLRQFLLIVNPTAPTPLKSYKLNLCLVPATKSCSPNDDDQLEWASGDKCSESHFQFSLGADGVLRHSCSGKMVCPQGSRNGAKIVVSSSCTADDSKFERTSGWNHIITIDIDHFIVKSA